MEIGRKVLVEKTLRVTFCTTGIHKLTGTGTDPSLKKCHQYSVPVPVFLPWFWCFYDRQSPQPVADDVLAKDLMETTRTGAGNN